MAAVLSSPHIPDFITPPIPGESHRYYGNVHNHQVKLPIPGPSLKLSTKKSASARQQEVPNGIETDIYEAASSGNVFLLRELMLREHVNEPQPSTGLTPLHYAASRGHIELVRCLIEDAGAILDLPDREGETALLKAAYNGHLLVVQFLVTQHHANIHQKDKDGWTAIHNACSRGHFKMVQFLVEQGANVDARSKIGHTALINAASKGLLDIVEYLLYEADANPLLKNNFGETAYDAAAAAGEAYICEVLQRSEKLWWTGKKKSENDFDLQALTNDQPYDLLNFHVTVIVTLHENQRAVSSFPSMLSLSQPKFSATALLKSDIRGPWSLYPSGKPSSKNDVHLPLSATAATSNRHAQRAWFWLTDWQIDLTDPRVDPSSGWQYARGFEDAETSWSPVMVASGVRRRRWVRVMKRRMDLVGDENSEIDNRAFEQDDGAGDYIERAEAVLKEGMMTVQEEGSDDDYVKTGYEGGEREELKRYEDSIQILLTGMKLDMNPHRKQQAAAVISAHLQHAERLKEIIDGGDIPVTPSQPSFSANPSTIPSSASSTVDQELGAYADNGAAFVHIHEGDLTSNPWSSGGRPNSLRALPRPGSGGNTPSRELPIGRLSRTSTSSPNIRIGHSANNSTSDLRTVELMGAGGDDRDNQRFSRPYYDDTESVSSTFETLSTTSQPRQSTRRPTVYSTSSVSAMVGQTLSGRLEGNIITLPSGERARPQWENDIDAQECRRCRRKFTFLVRRHHCRRCGLVVCDRCSTNRATLQPHQIISDPHAAPTGTSPPSEPQQVRVCDTCYSDLGFAGGASSSGDPYGFGDSTQFTPSTDLHRTHSNQSTMNECPVCGINLNDIPTKTLQEQHVKECLEGNGERRTLSGVRYVVYKLAPNSTLIGQECVICMEEFQTSETVARLNCLCTYHRHCIHSWISRGKDCPVHYR